MGINVSDIFSHVVTENLYKNKAFELKQLPYTVCVVFTCMAL